MSHPLYNPYESGNQSSSQGPYGPPSVQAERDPRRATSVLGPGSSFSSPATPANHGGNIQSQPVNYRPEQSRARVNVGDMERSVDPHVSRDREEGTPTGQSTRFTYTGTTSYPMSSTSASGGRRQYDVERTSSSLDWLPCYKGSTAADSSNYFPPPASCSRTSSGVSTFNASSDRQRDGQSVPRLGDYDYRVPDKPATPSATSQPTYTSESASSILLNFGLQREDLEYLVQYPEDQLTPAKLPFILREIRIQKTNRAMNAVESKPYPEPQPFRGASGRDSLTGSGGSSAVLQPSKVIDYGHTSKYVGGVGDEIGKNSDRSTPSGGSGSMMSANTNNSSHSQEPPQKEGSSVAKTSYNSIQSSLAPPRIDPAKQVKTQPIQTPQTIVSSSSLPRKDGDRTVYTPEACKPLPLKQLETDRKLASVTQPSPTLFRSVHPDRPGLVLIGSSDASGAKNPTTTQGKGSVVAEQRQMQQRQQNQIKPMQQSQMPQSQMPQSQMPQSQMHRMPPSQMPPSQMPPSQMPPSQMLQSHMHRMPPSQMPPSQMHQMPPSQMHRMPPSQMPPSQMHRMPPSQMPPGQMPPSQMPQSQMPPSQMPQSQMPPSQMQQSQMQQSQMAQSQMHRMPQSQMPQSQMPQKKPERSTIIPGPINHPPPQPVLSSMNFPQSQAPSSSQGPAKKPVSKGLPAPGMMYDYAAASPRAFPHTCSLCFKECSQMKDWISHQNTSLHLESCRVLRTKYPEWKGDIVLKPRDAGKDVKPSSSAPAQTHQQRQKKSSHGSHSRSHSPRRHFSSEGRGEKRSRSRSPRSSRYSHSSRSRSRSRSPRYDRHRSRSRSQERPGRRGERSPPKRSDMRRSPPRRTDIRGSPPGRTDVRRSPLRRTDMRRSPPGRTDIRRSPPGRTNIRRSPLRTTDMRRSPLRTTDMRRSPPRRTDMRGSPPGRTGMRRSPPGRTGLRRSPPPRTYVKRSPLRRSDGRRSPQKRSRERRLSSERSPSPRKSSTERLAQKLLQNTDVQSLSKQTDLEAVVKTLLAEITKMKSSSSSSTSSATGGKNVKSTPAAGRMGSSSAASSSSCPSAAKKTTTLTKAGLKKSDSSASTKTKSGRPTSSPPTRVRLGGIPKIVAHSDMVTAMEQFGEIESIVMHRHKLQALVTFKKEEDAKKLKSLGEVIVKGFPIPVVKDWDTEPKKTLLKKPAVSGVSTSQTSKSTKPTTGGKVPSKSVKTLLTRPKKPLASASAAKGTPPGKCANRKTAVKGSSSLTKAKVLVPKPRTVSSKPIAKTAKSGLQQGRTVEVSKSKSSSLRTSVSELVPEVKVEVETASVSQEPQTPVDNLAAAGDPTKVKVEEQAADVTPKSTISEKHTELKSKELDSKVQQSVVVLEDSVKVKTGVETVPELKHEPEPVTVDEVTKEAGGAEPMELGETGVDVAGPTEAEEKQTTVEAVSEKSTESQPPTRKDETRPPAVPPPDTDADPKPADTSSQMLQTTIETETAEKASAQVPEPDAAAPESKSSEGQPSTSNDETGPPTVPPVSSQVQGLESTELSAASGLVIQMEASRPPSSTEEEEKTTTEQEDPASAVKNQMDPKSAEGADKVSTEPTAGAVSELQPAGTTSSPAVPHLTIGEMVEKLFNPEKKFSCLKQKTYLSKQGRRQVVITNLPKYDDGPYTEEDVANLLIPFGFKYSQFKIYVLPQICVAFVEMPTGAEAHHIIDVSSSHRGITFKGNKLELHVDCSGFRFQPVMFYKSVMNAMNSSVDDTRHKIIYINNISPSEAQDLREVLRKTNSVTNYLPLLNKVFIELESSLHADRLGVWYSHQKQGTGQTVLRLRPLWHKAKAFGRLAANALPDREYVPPGATSPSVEFEVPQGSLVQYWVTMATSPFTFRTLTPCFIIPDCMTVKRDMDMKKVKSQSTMYPTLLLTGLPDKGYSQEDVARLVWPYFPKHFPHSLNNNVIVLTLQRRAFVHFSRWRFCLRFIQDHIKRQIPFKQVVLEAHFVLDCMIPESREELIYKSMMKWSNSRVPDPQSLEERLLCVDISETSVHIIQTVMKTVASIAKFVSYLPLANRICVEMVDSSGVAQVVEKFRSPSMQRIFGDKVNHVESVKSRKQRLEGSSEIFINLEPEDESPPPEHPDNDPQLVLQTSDSASAKPAAPNEPITGEAVAAEPSSTAAGDVVMEEDKEKVGPEIVPDSGVGPQANKEVEKVAETEEVSTTATIDAPADGTSVPEDSTTGVVASEETSTDLPRINQDVFRAIKAAVHRHRLTQETKTQSEENESSSNISVKDEVTHQEKVLEDLHTSDTFSVDEPQFNIRDFVTVDEVAEDVEEMSPDPHSSSSSSGRKETRSSDTSSAPKQTSNRSSPRSLKDSKSSASSSSKSPKDPVKRSSSSISTSVSPKKTKDSSKPTKSSSSASASFLSLETSPSSCHKAQQSKTQSSRSSPTARERVKKQSAAVERPPVSQREAAKESVVAKSDHKVSAESIAAKTDESETKIEKSSEMHPSAQTQRFGSNQDQNMETGLKDTTHKDPETGKEKKEEEEDEDDDGEKYEILDSFDHRTNENIEDMDQVASSDTKSPEPESLQEENFQVLDSVVQEDDGGEACSEKVVEGSTEDKRATVQEESCLVEDGGSTGKQLSQEEEVPALMTSAESCKPSKDVQEPEDRIPQDEDQPPKVCDNKDNDVTEQETFEILDSIDDQTIMEQNTEAQSDQMSTDITRREEEEDASKVVDSVTEQPITTESESDNKKPDATSRRDDRSSKRSGLRTRASKSEEKVKSPEKQDRVVKRSETPQDSTARLPQRDQDPEEEKVSEMVHSTEELVQEAAATERTDRRRSGRGKKEDKMTLNLTEASEKPDEILDSVEDETVTEEPVVMTRSTRGRRGRTTQKDQTKKEDTPTRSRRTPAKESQEKTLEMEKEASSKEDSPTKKCDITVREEIDEDATYEILDSVEDEVLQDDRPPTGGKRKRGRPKKAVKSTRKNPVTLKGDKDASEKEADDEKVSYQILDSVEDEMVEDQPPTEESSKNEEEEEPLYQIVDSVEDDQVQEESMTTEESKDETCPKEEEAAVQEDAPTCRNVVETSEKVVTKDLDNDPSTGLEKRESSSKEHIKEEGSSTTTSQKDPTTPEVEKNQVTSALVDLDEVSDEEEDYFDDIAEEEELRESKAAAKEKQLVMKEERRTREKEERRTREKEERRTREKEERRSREGEERRSRERRSQSSSSSSSGGGGDRRRTMERGREKEEEVDTKEMVTLDEVGADEAGEEVELQGGEPGGLVTLDEIIEEEEEEGKGENRLLEPRPPSKDEESRDSLNPEYLVTLDEAGEDEEEKVDEAEKTTSAKRKNDDDTEDNVNFVTVDEVGEVEEEEEEEEHKAPKTRGRAKKKTRKTPVRKSARGRKVEAKDESEEQEAGACVAPPTSLDASLSPDKDPSSLLPDVRQEIQKKEEEGAKPPETSAVEELQPGSLEAEEEKEGWSSADVKVVSKRKKEIVGPEAKRSRSQSPSVPADFKLPPFRANQPLGQEFVVPKSGYFCNICRFFYLSESSAKDVHCSSQAHYNNLQAYYQKRQQNQSGSSTPNSQGFISD
ncbi:uncharacterized protein LOC132996280 [Limanda limanda]|uniref:uncharacterized protein LOC132996280 n=1 Tax=Limanda limanda TaxID=27771 RepID=UPI0029C81784|nr:uncharacterized protein LOC132996280 [Limanda limanda]